LTINKLYIIKQYI